MGPNDFYRLLKIGIRKYFGFHLLRLELDKYFQFHKLFNQSIEDLMFRKYVKPATFVSYCHKIKQKVDA